MNFLSADLEIKRIERLIKESAWGLFSQILKEIA